MMRKSLIMRSVSFGAGLKGRERIGLPALALCVALFSQGGFASSDGDVTGDVNPIVNPNDLTIFPVEDIATLRSTQTIASTVLFDYVAASSDLDVWHQMGQQLSGSDPCNQSLGRRLHAGRVTTPAFEQAVCQTPFGVSLYYGEQPTPDGAYITYSYLSPGIGIDYRNFDAEIGLFDRTASATDSLFHMDIATVHRDLYGILTVSIIGYEPAATEGEVGQLVLRDSWTDPRERQITGDATLALGDYNNDGALDILVWADTSTGTDDAQTGRIDMTSFSYDAINRQLNHVGTIEIETVGKPASIVSAAGDFANNGVDQAMMAYYPTNGSNSIQLSHFQLNEELEPAQPRIVRSLHGRPASTSYFEIEAGLFAFDPSQSSPINGSPGFHTRQLALTWVEDTGEVYASVVALADNGESLKETGVTKLGDPQYVSKADDIGPSLAVGNYIGLQDDGVDPMDQIAVAIPTIDSENQNATVTEVVTALVNYNANTGNFSIEQTDTIREPAYWVQGLVYGPGLTALDSLGRAFFLGNPAHISVPALIDPQYTVYMPPHHVDYLPDPDDPDQWSVVNISAYKNFNVTLSDESSSTVSQESTDTSSTNLGMAGSLSVSETVSADFLEIASVSTTAQISDVLSYQSNETTKNINSSYETLETQKSATTNIDDQLGFNQRIIDIWRYPVFGLDLSTPEEHPYYEIVIPGVLTPFQSDGLVVSWFSPDHINNNALSYPIIGASDFPSDVGVFTYNDNGEDVSKETPLNDMTVRSFSGNSQSYELTYTEGSGGSSERSYEYNLSNSLDIKIGFTAEVGVGFAGVEAEMDAGFNLTNGASWGNSTVASRSMSNSKGIMLNQPTVTGIQDKAYDYQTAVYITDNGGIKVAHAVDFDTQTGRGWWFNTYQKADPALNLPLRFVQSTTGFWWFLNEEESYHWMRGISITSNEYNTLTESYPYISGGVDQGKEVRVLVQLYNLSLGSETSDTQVQFAYQALDPSTFAPVGDPVVFETSAPMVLQPLAQQQVVGLWDTSELNIAESTPYRFVITVLTDADNDLHATGADGGNNMGVWPYSGSGIFVFPMPPDSSSPAGASATQGMVQASVELRERNVDSHHSYKAIVTMDTDEDHKGAVDVLVTLPDQDGQGRDTVIGSARLWGLPAGKRKLDIRVPYTSMHGYLKGANALGLNGVNERVKVRVFSHHSQ